MNMLVILQTLTLSRIVDLHNVAVLSCEKYSNQPFIYHEIGEMFGVMSPSEIARAVHFGQINWLDDYFVWNRLGNVSSFFSASCHENPIDLDLLAEVIESGEVDLSEIPWLQNALLVA